MRTIYPPAAISFLVPGAFIVATEGWATFFLALGIAIALLAGFLAARGFWLAHRQVDQIVREEVDAHRALEAARRELHDPDPFAMERRVEPREENP